MVDQRHPERPAELYGHNILANHLSFILRQIFKPLAHRLPSTFCAEENGRQWSAHCMTVSFLIQLPSDFREVSSRRHPPVDSISFQGGDQIFYYRRICMSWDVAVPF